MPRWMPAAVVGLALVAASIPGCAATSDRQGHSVSGEEAEEAHSTEFEDLGTRQFTRGGRAGLAKARGEGRGAMLLFVASW